MVNKTLIIVVGILLLVGLGFFFVSNMTGNVITGSAVTESINVDEPFRISEFGIGDDGVAVGVGVDAEDAS